MHDDHCINRAIRRNNAIVRLIFKNTKDSVAITSGSGGKISVPYARNPAEDQRFQELYKIVRQMHINIPKKFDSKAALREFFYSKEFIQTIKSKMTDQLHSAILRSHDVPRSHVE